MGLRPSFDLVSDAVATEHSDPRYGKIVQCGLQSRREGDTLIWCHIFLCMDYFNYPGACPPLSSRLIL